MPPREHLPPQMAQGLRALALLVTTQRSERRRDYASEQKRRERPDTFRQCVSHQLTIRYVSYCLGVPAFPRRSTDDDSRLGHPVDLCGDTRPLGKGGYHCSASRCGPESGSTTCAPWTSPISSAGTRRYRCRGHHRLPDRQRVLVTRRVDPAGPSCGPRSHRFDPAKTAHAGPRRVRSACHPRPSPPGGRLPRRRAQAPGDARAVPDKRTRAAAEHSHARPRPRIGCPASEDAARCLDCPPAPPGNQVDGPAMSSSQSSNARSSDAMASAMDSDARSRPLGPCVADAATWPTSRMVMTRSTCARAATNRSTTCRRRSSSSS